MINDFEKLLMSSILKLNTKLCFIESELENTQQILCQTFSSGDKVSKNVKIIRDNFENWRKGYDNYCEQLDKQLEEICNKMENENDR